MAAIVCEFQTGGILIVTTEYRQQFTCGHLNQSESRRYTLRQTYNSVFNINLVTKLRELRLNTALCDWIGQRGGLIYY